MGIKNHNFETLKIEKDIKKIFLGILKEGFEI